MSKKVVYEDIKDLDEELETISVYSIQLNSLIEKLQNIRNKYSEKYYRIDVVTEYDSYVSFLGHRYETDEEYNERLEKENFNENLNRQIKNKKVSLENLKIKDSEEIKKLKKEISDLKLLLK